MKDICKFYIELIFPTAYKYYPHMSTQFAHINEGTLKDNNKADEWLK